MSTTETYGRATYSIQMSVKSNHDIYSCKMYMRTSINVEKLHQIEITGIGKGQKLNACSTKYAKRTDDSIDRLINRSTEQGANYQRSQ